MPAFPALQRQPDGDLVLPADTARFLVDELRHLQVLLGHQHGHQVVASGRAETQSETAYRQDSVNQLSAAIGITATTVQAGAMPATTHAVNHSAAIERIDQLCQWLESVV